MAGTSVTVKGFSKAELDSAMRSLGLTEAQVDKANKRTLSAMGAWMIREMRNTLRPGGHQGQPGGDKWEDLSPEWKAVKRREGRPTHIGIYEGRMQNSISIDIDKTKLSVEGGPTMDYSEWFDKHRPLTPKEGYSAERLAVLMVDSLRKEAR